MNTTLLDNELDSGVMFAKILREGDDIVSKTFRTASSDEHTFNDGIHPTEP